MGRGGIGPCPREGGWLRCKTEQRSARGKTTKCKHHPPPGRAAGSQEQSGDRSIRTGQSPAATSPAAAPRHGAAATRTFHCVSMNPAVPDLPQKLMQRPILKIKQNKRTGKKKKKKAREVGVSLLSFPEHPRPQATFKLRRLQAVCSLPRLFSCLLGNFSSRPPSLTWLLLLPPAYILLRTLGRTRSSGPRLGKANAGTRPSSPDPRAAHGAEGSGEQPREERRKLSLETHRLFLISLGMAVKHADEIN